MQWQNRRINKYMDKNSTEPYLQGLYTYLSFFIFIFIKTLDKLQVFGIFYNGKWCQNK